MASIHEEFTNKILALIQTGTDPLVALDSEKEHLLDCPRCRKNITRLAKQALGLDLSFLEDLYAQGELAEPARYPAPDFTFGGKRIISITGVVDLHLKLPRSRYQIKGMPSEQLASVVLPKPDTQMVNQVTERLTLPRSGGLVVELSAGAPKPDALNLEARFAENPTGFSSAGVRLVGPGGERARAGALDGSTRFEPVDPGRYEMLVWLAGPQNIPVLAWRIQINLQVTFFLDLTTSRKVNGS